MATILKRERMIEPCDGRCVFPGFIGYAHAERPVLLHCYGWVDASDTFDDYAISVSDDNGSTWSEPVMCWQSEATPGGRVRYAEPTFVCDPQTGEVLLFVKRAFYPANKHTQTTDWEVVIGRYDLAKRQWTQQQVTDFGLPHGLGQSFSFPIITRTGRLIIPMQRPLLDASGQFVHHRGYWSRAYEALVLIGERNASGDLVWQMSDVPMIDLEQSCRGLCEPTVVELASGRLAMVARGDNGVFPEKPGYKWVSFSDDGGQTWSDAQPLGSDDGTLYESSSTGSALFRSATDRAIYWLGNLGVHGQRAKGNWPRSPLVLAKVREEPFTLMRNNMVVIDDIGEEDSPRTQLSNFRFYQDRQTGELNVFLTRFGERSAELWRDATYWRYVISDI